MTKKKDEERELKYIRNPKARPNYLKEHLGDSFQAKCKICTSPWVEDITNDLINNVSYTKIVAKYPELNLNHTNIKNHKRHMKLLPKGVEIYMEARQEGIIKVVNELKVLDETYSKCYEYIVNVNFEKAPPRKIEVVGELMLKAIRLKADLVGSGQDPGQQLADLFKKAMGGERVGEVSDSR